MQVNETKTEVYEIARKVDDKLEKCKYPGSLLDTENDINRKENFSDGSIQSAQISLSKQKSICKYQRQTF